MSPPGERRIVVEVEVGGKKYVFPISVIIPRLNVSIRIIGAPLHLGPSARDYAIVEIYNSAQSDLPLSDAILVVEPVNERITIPKVDIGKSIILKVPVVPGLNTIKVIHEDRILSQSSINVKLVKPEVRVELEGKPILYYPKGGVITFRIVDNNIPYKITDIKIHIGTGDPIKIITEDKKIKVEVSKLSKLIDKVPLTIEIAYKDLAEGTYKFKKTYTIAATLLPELKQEIEETVWAKVRNAEQLLSQGLIGNALALLEEALANCNRFSGIIKCKEIKDKISKAKRMIGRYKAEIERTLPTLEELLKQQKYKELEEKIGSYVELCSKVGKYVEACKRIEQIHQVVSGIKYLLTKGVIVSFPKRVRPRPFKATLNIMNPLSETIRGLTIDFTPSREFFEFEEEKIVIPVIRGGTKGLSRDFRIKPKYKGELVLIYRIGLGDYIIEREEPIVVEERVAPPLRVDLVKRLIGKGIPSLATYGKPTPKVFKLTRPVRILDYECISLLGTGGFAVTLLGIDKKKRKVVVKTTIEHYNMLLTGAGLEYPTVEDELIRKFDREARILKELNHPNIVKLLEYTTQPPVLVLEYCELGDLRGLLTSLHGRGKGFHPKEALELIIPITDALAYAHSLKEPIIHRDIKPENILLTKDYIPKLTDFNIAKIMSTVSKTSRSKGEYTPGYAAPEQLGISDLPSPGPYTDVFAIATVLYEILTLRRPYPLEVYENLFREVKRPTPPSKINPEVSKELDEVILLSLEIDPSDRPQNAQELESMLTEIYSKYYM